MDSTNLKNKTKKNNRKKTAAFWLMSCRAVELELRTFHLFCNTLRIVSLSRGTYYIYSTKYKKLNLLQKEYYSVVSKKYKREENHKP